MDNLKPCPFCGSEKIKIYRNGNSHYAYCDICKASSKDNSVSTSEDVIIGEWNRRTPLKKEVIETWKT